MSTDVTYLVVGEVQSNKYVVASEQGINCVTPDWINHLWDISVKQLQAWLYHIESFKFLIFW